jgi:hypothetical protein
VNRLPPGPADDGTLGGYGSERLLALCRAAGMADRAGEIADVFATMSESWSQRPLAAPPLWSFATADSTPVQFSVAFGSEPVSVGISAEAQADPASPAAYWDSARRLSTRLADRYGVPLERLRRIEDLFRPGTATTGSMVAYHAAAWPRQGGALFKIYLWAGGLDPAGCAARCDEALTRLGFAGQWPRIAAALDPQDVVAYLSLDLAAGPAARTKVYVHHRGRLTAARLERVASLAADFVPGAAAELADLAGEAEGASRWAPRVPAVDRLQWRSNRRRHWPAGTYLSLVAGQRAPVESAVHQFSLATLIRDDEEAAALVRAMAARYGVPAGGLRSYERCLEVFAQPPLSRERYAHEFVSFSRAGGTPRVAVYFNPRMFLARFGLTNGDLSRSWEWSAPATSAGLGRCSGARAALRRSPWGE